MGKKMRDIHSAHPEKMRSYFVESGHSKVLFSATQRSSTIPLEIVKEKRKKVFYRKHIKKSCSKNLKSIKSAKGGGFTVTGTKFNIRAYTTTRKYNKNALPSCMIIKSQKSLFSSILHKNRVQTAYATTTDFNQPQKFSFGESEGIQQVNVLTSSVRPTTAAVRVEEKKEWLTQSQDRPMSAYILTDGFLKGYVPTAYIKPFTVRHRPISAAVSSKISSEKDCLSKVNPEKVKTKYQRYLKELEMEAKQFIIEEDNYQGSKKLSDNEVPENAYNTRYTKVRTLLINI